MNKFLLVGARVDREDGRFYIPVFKGDVIVLRVASDAFDGNEELANIFACKIANAYNRDVN